MTNDQCSTHLLYCLYCVGCGWYWYTMSLIYCNGFYTVLEIQETQGKEKTSVAEN
jgi:hypothetical protein